MHCAPRFEEAVIEEGVQLIKYWFEVDMEEQAKRFRNRIDDPRKVWKFSPMDVESYKRWYEIFPRARRNAACHRHRTRALAHRGRGRQEASAA